MVAICLLTVLIATLAAGEAGMSVAERGQQLPSWLALGLLAGLSPLALHVLEVEHEFGAYQGLLQSKLSAQLLFFTKTCWTFLLLLILSLALWGSLNFALAINFSAPALSFLSLSLWALATAPVVTLVAAACLALKGRSMLMPVVLLPPVFPLFLALIRINGGLAFGEDFALLSWWYELLFGLAVVFWSIGVLIFPSLHGDQV